MEAKPEYFEMGDVHAWMEQSTSIHLKAVTRFGDPVELTCEEARRLAAVLDKYATQLADSPGSETSLPEPE